MNQPFDAATLRALLAGLKTAREAAQKGQGMAPASVKGLPKERDAVAILLSHSMSEANPAPWYERARKATACFYGGRAVAWGDLHELIDVLGRQVEYLLPKAEAEERRKSRPAPARETPRSALEQAKVAYNRLATDLRLADLPPPSADLAVREGMTEAEAQTLLAAIEREQGNVAAKQRAAKAARAKAAAEARATAIKAELARLDAESLAATVADLGGLAEELDAGNGAEVIAKPAEVISALGLTEVRLAAIIASMPDHWQQKAGCEDRLAQAFSGRNVNGQPKPSRAALGWFIRQVLRQAEYLLEAARKREGRKAAKAKEEAFIANFFASAMGANAAKASAPSMREQREAFDRLIQQMKDVRWYHARAKAKMDFIHARSAEERAAVIRRLEQMLAPATTPTPPVAPPPAPTVVIDPSLN